MRSPAGVSDGTSRGFDTAKSWMNLSAFSFPMILCRLPSHWAVVVCWLGSGKTTFPLYCGLVMSSRAFGACDGLVMPERQNPPITVLRYAGPRFASTTFFGKAFAEGESYFAKS